MPRSTYPHSLTLARTQGNTRQLDKCLRRASTHTIPSPPLPKQPSRCKPTLQTSQVTTSPPSTRPSLSVSYFSLLSASAHVHTERERGREGESGDGVMLHTLCFTPMLDILDMPPSFVLPLSTSLRRDLPSTGITLVPIPIGTFLQSASFFNGILCAIVVMRHSITRRQSKVSVFADGTPDGRCQNCGGDGQALSWLGGTGDCGVDVGVVWCPWDFEGSGGQAVIG